MNLYSNLESLCKDCGITIEELEKQMMQNRNDHDSSIPSITIVEEVANKLGISVDELCQDLQCKAE